MLEYENDVNTIVSKKESIKDYFTESGSIYVLKWFLCFLTSEEWIMQNGVRISENVRFCKKLIKKRIMRQ